MKDGDNMTLTRDGTTNISGLPEEGFLTGTAARNSVMDLRDRQQETINVGQDLLD